MITVVIASYRYGHLAAHCIESILSQTKRPDKILFVDDGVGDCEHLKYLYPEVEFVLRPKNIGRVANFQDMLERVETDMCLFIGADNWLRSDAIELLSNQDSDIVTYDIIVTGEFKFSKYESVQKNTKDNINYYLGDYYWPRVNKHHGSMLYNVELAKKCRYDADGLNKAEDFVLWNKMLTAGAKVTHISEGLLYYRSHRENDNKYNVMVEYQKKLKQMRDNI
jgi:glycosyltransferase involved in cell wall biosynthesis